MSRGSQSILKKDITPTNHRRTVQFTEEVLRKAKIGKKAPPSRINSTKVTISTPE